MKRTLERPSLSPTDNPHLKLKEGVLVFVGGTPTGKVRDLVKEDRQRRIAKLIGPKRRRKLQADKIP